MHREQNEMIARLCSECGWDQNMWYKHRRHTNLCSQDIRAQENIVL